MSKEELNEKTAANRPADQDNGEKNNPSQGGSKKETPQDLTGKTTGGGENPGKKAYELAKGSGTNKRPADQTGNSEDNNPKQGSSGTATVTDVTSKYGTSLPNLNVKTDIKTVPTGFREYRNFKESLDAASGDEYFTDENGETYFIENDTRHYFNEEGEVTKEVAHVEETVELEENGIYEDEEGKIYRCTDGSLIELSEEEITELTGLSINTLNKATSKAKSKAKSAATQEDRDKKGMQASKFAKAAGDKVMNKEETETTDTETLFKEDVKKLLDEKFTDLTEEQKEETSKLFEAQVIARTAEQMETIEKELQEEAEAKFEQVKEEYTTKLDTFIDYMLEQWFLNNEVSIERGIEQEITENFMSKLKQIFTESYIEIPEAKVDVVSELNKEIEEATNKNNALIKENLEIKEHSDKLNKLVIIDEVASDLTIIEKDKVIGLTENIKFTDGETFEESVKMIIKTHITEAKTETIAEDTVGEGDDPSTLVEDTKKAKKGKKGKGWG